MATNDRNLTIRLPGELLATLEAAAKAEGLRVGEYVRRAIEGRMGAGAELVEARRRLAEIADYAGRPLP